MSHRRWTFRIQDMLAAARKIERYTEGLAFEDFVQDEKTIDAVIRQFNHCWRSRISYTGGHPLQVPRHSLG